MREGVEYKHLWQIKREGEGNAKRGTTHLFPHVSYIDNDIINNACSLAKKIL